jgi:hypothetical protein
MQNTFFSSKSSPFWLAIRAHLSPTSGILILAPWRARVESSVDICNNLMHATAPDLNHCADFGSRHGDARQPPELVSTDRWRRFASLLLPSCIIASYSSDRISSLMLQITCQQEPPWMMPETWTGYHTWPARLSSHTEIMVKYRDFYNFVESSSNTFIQRFNRFIESSSDTEIKSCYPQSNEDRHAFTPRPAAVTEDPLD